jgi:ribosomal protein S18 acetylase RimI-like enzyme
MTEQMADPSHPTEPFLTAGRAGSPTTLDGAGPPTIRTARPEEIAGLASTLADAFNDDPAFGWCLPDPAQRSAVLPRFFRLAAEAVVPHRESTVLDGGRSVALVVPPGVPAVAESDAEAFGDAVIALLGDATERTFALMAMLDEIHPTEPHRFLWFIGTRRADRGSGLGSALLRQMLDRCDLESVAAYLDATSEDNRRLYERHGFEVVGRHTVADSPPLWSMWRRPAGR